MAERQDLRDAGSRCLEDSTFQNGQSVGGFGVNAGEHHDRLEAKITAAFAQLLGRLGIGLGGDDRDFFAAALFVSRAPGDVVKTGGLNSR